MKKKLVLALFLLCMTCGTSIAAEISNSEEWYRMNKSTVVWEQAAAVGYITAMCDSVIRLGVIPNNIQLSYGTYADLLMDYLNNNPAHFADETFVNFVRMLKHKDFIAGDDKAILGAMAWIRKQ
ncbi:hypothetical protein [Pseudodesulfovibrio senegalensis]|uniref:Rap1a immunity protein domain-containing protein n=1 Tax=Pseudodesulfovibrio senegalensis TaxID=1721087 RepID=A0A6N6N032_9BACT|nr:hypothetical protein [Pseudodesulfovibrio senegalensis]KAB1440387.1 hypothetical protein F8A88_14170 [Pseudodesulfovibrio senegalensis]